MMPNWKIVVTGLLGLTALSKCVSIFHPGPLLMQRDAVFQIPLIGVVIAASVLELGILVLIWSVREINAVRAVLIFATIVLAYRIAAPAAGFRCPCLGYVSNWWPFFAQYETQIMTTVAVWLWLTSVIKLAALTRNGMSS
jgi:hypothetical protein